MHSLIIELEPQEAIYQYANYRYCSIHVDEDELDGLLAILRVWITETECHTFLIDPKQCNPPCKTRAQFWQLLRAHLRENRFVVHGEP